MSITKEYLGKDMRPRHKKHLTERIDRADKHLLRLNKPEPNFQVANENKEYINFCELFGNNAPVDLEIGSGMGDFAITYAKNNPDRNIVAIEQVRDVLVVALEKIADEDIKNLRFLSISAEYLPKYFKDDSIENIFLNFSTPFPKKAYAKKRLTSDRFLESYKCALKNGGRIVQKTDNVPLFEYSLERLEANGFEIKEKSFDMYSEKVENNIATEYEKKFLLLGTKICRLVAVNKK